MASASSSQAAQLQAEREQGPPYPPQGAALGGVPTVQVDVPIDSVLIFLYLLAAAINMTLFRLNRRRGHKFVLSAMLFGFCMARTLANALRIAWACNHRNVRLAIAASIVAYAGVVLLFAVNLILTQRIFRALHPHLGWTRPANLLFRFLYFAIVASILMLIAAVIYSFYTLDPRTLARLHDILLTGITFLAVLAFLPLPLVLLFLVLPRRVPVDHFGHGSMRTKILLVLFTATLLAFGAAFRAATSYLERARDDPGWFDSKACYFCVNYAIELTCVYSYTAWRFDRRFHVPDGSCAPGHYSRDGPDGTGLSSTGRLAVGAGGPPNLEADGVPPTVDEQEEKERAWHTRLQKELERTGLGFHRGA